MKIKISKQTAMELELLYFLYSFVNREYVYNYGEKVCFVPQAVIEAGAGLIANGALHKAYTLDRLLMVTEADVEVEE